MSTTQKPGLLGQLIGGRFRVEKMLGIGGMGEVYLGRHELLGNRVAIKLLKVQHAKDQRMSARFRREARATSRVQHPNVVGIFDTGQLDDGRLFLIMEYIQGKNLLELYDEVGTLPLARALPIFVQIADALAAAHAMGIMHRDLKPDNIVIVPGEHGDLVKILDFGLAKMVEAEDDRITLPGEVFGTPQYMSLEQCMGEKLACATDIYSFGAVAYEALTGDPPFVAASLVEYVLAQKNRVPDPPSSRAPHNDVPPEIDQVILDCLETFVPDRIADGCQLVKRLREVQTLLAHRRLGSPADVAKRMPTSQFLAVDPNAGISTEELRCMVQNWLWERLMHVVQLLRTWQCFPPGLGPRMASAAAMADEIARMGALEQGMIQESQSQELQLRARSGQLRQAVQDLSFDREVLEKYLARHVDCSVIELVTAFPGLGIYSDCGSVQEILSELIFQITELEKRYSELQMELFSARETRSANALELFDRKHEREREKTRLVVEVIEELIGPGGSVLRKNPILALELETLSLYYQETSQML
ncbi:serine/threonine protein kinase [Myxococcota bacterium]|nr:serine/threonine protein kinase [Myxococcota bacterium]